jgi:HSP20 family protein
MAQREKSGERIEVVFTDVWQFTGSSTLRRGFLPNLDCYHTDDPHELTVVVEVAGVDPRSLTIAVSERVLVIAGERRRARARGRVYQQVEIEYGPFERRVQLAEDVDPALARARYAQGMVTISLPVAESSSGRRARRTIAVERG